jgi:hypothetical protein
MFVLSEVLNVLSEKATKISNMSVLELVTSTDFIVFLVTFTLGYAVTKNGGFAVILALFVSIALLVVPIATKESFELVYPGPDSAPSCMKIKKEDLLKHFEGKENKLKEAMVESQVPYNTELNDVNAPFIASFLINNPKINSIGDCRLVV